MYKRIMVPLDGSELAQTALPHAVELCRAFNATLLLLHVRDTHQGSQEASLRYLDFVGQAYASSGVAIEPLVREGPVAEAIIQAAAEQQADLIAMATHGRSGLSRAVYGSVADQVLRNSSAPILLVRNLAAPGDGEGK